MTTRRHCQSTNSLVSAGHHAHGRASASIPMVGSMLVRYVSSLGKHSVHRKAVAWRTRSPLQICQEMLISPHVLPVPTSTTPRNPTLLIDMHALLLHIRYACRKVTAARVQTMSFFTSRFRIHFLPCKCTTGTLERNVVG